MAKCLICGKHGLFLKVDVNGRCDSCAAQLLAQQRELDRQEEEDFNYFYASLLQLVQETNKSVSIGEDPVEALDCIPSIQKKIELCDKILDAVHNNRYPQRFLERMMASITYHDEFCERHLMGDINAWGISVHAQPLAKAYTAEDIYKSIDEGIEKNKKRWKQKIDDISRNAAFKSVLDAVPPCEITLSDEKYKKLSVSDLEDSVKYSSITAKTSMDRVGCFVAIDTETTGLSSSRDRIIEVAAVRFEDWEPVEKFETLIDPNMEIPYDATKINGITDEMVKGAPLFDQIISSLTAFIGKSNLVGHNLPFDLKFLYHYGLDFTSEKRKYFDTCEIAKTVLKKAKTKWDKEYGEYVINYDYDYDVEDYKLSTLCEYYKLRDDSFAHRALSDAYVTGLLFKKLVREKTRE